MLPLAVLSTCMLHVLSPSRTALIGLTVSPSDPNQAALSTLVNWLSPVADFHLVYIQHDDTGDHSLHALHSVPANTTVLSVSHSHMLTLDQAMESPIGHQLTQRWYNDTSRHAYIAAYLLSEAARGSESVWWSYLQSLPAFTNHLASAWSEEELQWLQGTEALDIARGQQQMVRESYEQARALPSFPFTYESYAHARRLVFSRLFSYTTAQGNRSVALVPLNRLNQSRAVRRLQHAVDVQHHSASVHYAHHRACGRPPAAADLIRTKEQQRAAYGVRLRAGRQRA